MKIGSHISWLALAGMAILAFLASRGHDVSNAVAVVVVGACGAHTGASFADRTSSAYGNDGR
jgi:NhaP-type Na+/H+ or K+/H+ antiporter